MFVIVACTAPALVGAGTTTPPQDALLRSLMQQRIKHVFVIVQENHSFDNYFGTYPGTAGQTVENLGTALAAASEQQFDPATGTTQGPFTVTDPHILGGDQSSIGTAVKIDGGKMDNWLREEEYGAALSARHVTPEKHANALDVMAVFDCNTVPYLWYYAKTFTLFDHYFQADTGPSTPANIQVFAAQIGQSEWARQERSRHRMSSSPANGGAEVPLFYDDNPPAVTFPGIFPYTDGDDATVQSYATMPVLLNPAEDAAAAVPGSIADDLRTEAASKRRSISWGWYEEGLTSGIGFSSHHTAPLYFDYIDKSPTFIANLHDNTPDLGLLPAIVKKKLPASGVFWIKGAMKSQFGFRPANGDTRFLGDDDHPGVGQSDHQVAEAYVATIINAIASKYWNDSVIILTWDDMGGYFDHVPPRQYTHERCPPLGVPCGDGPRLPMLVISPFSKTGVVVHDYNDAVSISKFIEDVFGLPRLGSLPDERPYEPEGPRDVDPRIGNLSGALDIAKLSGASTPNPASMATIVPSVPPAMSCSTLGLTPSPTLTSPPKGYVSVARLQRIPPETDDGD